MHQDLTFFINVKGKKKGEVICSWRSLDEHLIIHPKRRSKSRKRESFCVILKHVRN